MWVKIDGTLVNLNNVLAVQNRDELKTEYDAMGWMRLTVCVFSDTVRNLDYIYFEDKPCVRKAYAYLKGLCIETFED